MFYLCHKRVEPFNQRFKMPAGTNSRLEKWPVFVARVSLVTLFFARARAQGSKIMKCTNTALGQKDWWSEEKLTHVVPVAVTAAV